jgi:hypothetical protein
MQVPARAKPSGVGPLEGDVVVVVDDDDGGQDGPASEIILNLAGAAGCGRAAAIEALVASEWDVDAAFEILQPTYSITSGTVGANSFQALHASGPLMI